MSDREIVIKALENADVIDGVIRMSNQFKDIVVTLLKEQEAIKPTWSRGKPFCGACGLRIRGGKFCSECGREVKWE